MNSNGRRGKNKGKIIGQLLRRLRNVPVPKEGLLLDE